MPKCSQCGDEILWLDAAANGGFCDPCLAEAGKGAREAADVEAGKGAREAADVEAAKFAKIILTTETAHNLPVTERLGIVASECVFGMHLFKDLFSLGRDVFGGRSATMQNTLKEARIVALNELRAEAHALGADAIVGVDLDYSEISGGGKSMLFLVVSGTAVKLGS